MVEDSSSACRQVYPSKVDWVKQLFLGEIKVRREIDYIKMGRTMKVSPCRVSLCSYVSTVFQDLILKADLPAIVVFSCRIMLGHSQCTDAYSLRCWYRGTTRPRAFGWKSV